MKDDLKQLGFLGVCGLILSIVMIELSHSTMIEPSWIKLYFTRLFWDLSRLYLITMVTSAVIKVFSRVEIEKIIKDISLACVVYLVITYNISNINNSNTLLWIFTTVGQLIVIIVGRVVLMQGIEGVGDSKYEKK